MYYPNHFERSSDLSWSYIQQIIEQRWGTHDDGYLESFPENLDFPGDEPDALFLSVDDFLYWLSSGDIGLYLISTHGNDERFLVEPYCRDPQNPQNQAISYHLSYLAWLEYMNEDWCDDNVANADYNNNGTPLCGPNGQVESWLDQTTALPVPVPAGLPTPDDDFDDYYWAYLDNNEDGDLDDPEDNDDPEGDLAPGIRGNPAWGYGDGDDGFYDLQDLRLGNYHVGGAIFYHGISVTADFISYCGAYTPDALDYLGSCSTYWLHDAWMDGNMQAANYLSHTDSISPTLNQFVRTNLFKALGRIRR